MSFSAEVFYSEIFQSCRVGDHFPPETLPVYRWEMWSRINKLYEQNPQVFEKIKPSWFTALAVFYQLGFFEDTDLLRLKDVARAQGVSWQRISARKNQALETLELLDEE